MFTAVYQFVPPPPPLNEIQPPTNINPDEFSFAPPQIVTLANGNFAVTYSSVADVFFEVFDPLGQFVTGGVANGNDPAASGQPLRRSRAALRWRGRCLRHHLHGGVH